jgi:hypothetical protein
VALPRIREVTILFPSGRYERIIGRFCLTNDPEDQGRMVPAVAPVRLRHDRPGTTYLIDPRAVVRDETGMIVYEPRRFSHLLSDWFIAWLERHPEWPGGF